MTKIEPGSCHWFGEAWRGMELAARLAMHGRGDFLRPIAEAVLQLIMDFERQAIDPAHQS